MVRNRNTNSLLIKTSQPTLARLLMANVKAMGFGSPALVSMKGSGRQMLSTAKADRHGVMEESMMGNFRTVGFQDRAEWCGTHRRVY